MQLNRCLETPELKEIDNLQKAHKIESEIRKRRKDVIETTDDEVDDIDEEICFDLYDQEDADLNKKETYDHNNEEDKDAANGEK